MSITHFVFLSISDQTIISSLLLPAIVGSHCFRIHERTLTTPSGNLLTLFRATVCRCLKSPTGSCKSELLVELSAPANQIVKHVQWFAVPAKHASCKRNEGPQCQARWFGNRGDGGRVAN